MGMTEYLTRYRPVVAFTQRIVVASPGPRLVQKFRKGVQKKGGITNNPL